MNIKIFENDDHLVIDVSKQGLKNSISESSLLASLLSAITGLAEEKKKIPALAPVMPEPEPEFPKPEGFSYQDKTLEMIEPELWYDAMLAMWSYQKNNVLTKKETDVFKSFVCDNFCFMDEKTEKIDVLKHILVQTETECPKDDNDIREKCRQVIDDMINFAVCA